MAATEHVEQRALGLFAPIDRMMLTFIAFLAAVTAIYYPQPWPVLALLAFLTAVFVAVAAWGARSEMGQVVHAFIPLPIVITIFNVAGPLIGAANPTRWDGFMARADEVLFGPLVPAWRHLLGRPAWLTDAASIAYVSYYFIPFAMCIALWRQGRRREFDDFALALIATLLVSYLGYFLVPTSGPRVPHAMEVEVLGGGTVSAAVREFLRNAELNQLDAFPSGHTALSLVFLGFGWRLFPRWRVRIPLLITVVGIIFATVYLSLHYAIDLVAGATQAALMPTILRGLRRVFGNGGVGAPAPP
jgi:membrane-associated phospholipid phosphatase